MTDDQHNPDTALESATDALRDLPTAPGPDADFQEQLIQQLASNNHVSLSSELDRIPRRNVMHRVIGIAASLLIVAGVIGGILMFGGEPANAAFAAMLQKVTDARTAVFVVRGTRNDSNMLHDKTMVLEPDWVREEIGEGDQRTVLIFNMRELKSLQLSPATKKAVLRNMADVPPALRKNVITKIRELREASSKFVGKEQIGGKETRKYTCEDTTGHYVLWIDAETDLPVKVVMTETADTAKSSVAVTLSEFQWNVPLDAALFTLDAPQGYELREEKIPNGSDPKDFVATLKAYVRLNNDQFPDEFNALTPGSMGKFLDDPALPEKERMANRRRKLAQAMGRENLDKMSEDDWKKLGPEIGQTLARGAVFLQILGQAHDWHYVGKGVKLGEAEKIVAWWAPKATGDKSPEADQPTKATVLYGDLHMETKPAKGLPTGS